MGHGVVRKRLDFIHLLKMLAQHHRDLAFPDLHGSGLTPSKPAVVYSAQGIWLLRWPVIVGKGADSRARNNILPHFSPSKWSPGSLRCRQEPGNLVDENISCHLKYRSAPVHLLQTKKKNYKNVNYVESLTSKPTA